MVTRSGWLKLGGAVLGVVVVLGVVAAGVAATTFERPTVENSSYAWGAVTDKTTEIQSTIVVDNPNPVGIPGLIGIDYTAKLNDVTLATGHRSNVGFGPGTNTVDLTTEMQNERIADWWVTHVNNDERSTMRITATVSAPGFSKEIPAKKETIKTDILGGFTESGTRTITVRNESFVQISDQHASWGKATAETTPITFSSTIRNVHDYPVTLDGVEYVVTMAGVELGRGRKTTGVHIEPGQQDDLDVTVALDTPKMADWWAAHVKDGEESNLTVEMYGIVDKNGEPTRAPIRLFDDRLHLQTDMLGGGGTNVTSLDTPRQDVTWPEITDTERQWGAVTDTTTEINATSTVDAPDSNLTDLVSMDLRQHTTINGVTVATGSRQVSNLSPGPNPVTMMAKMDNSMVPVWWARHLNNGERSTIETVPRALADVGFTKFDVALDNQTSIFQTDLLANMNGDRNEVVSVRGRRALVVHSVHSKWGRATPQTAPLHVTASVENDLPVQADVSKVHYHVALNDVVLADKTARNVDTLPADSTSDLSLTMQLNNQKMDEWWVTHVRNGERSDLNVSVVVTVDSVAGSTTQRLDSLGQSTTIETDVLDQKGN